MRKKLLLVAAFVAVALVRTVHAVEPLKINDDNRYSFLYDCAGFQVNVDGQNSGWHTIYFNKDREKLRNVGYHHVAETHRNLLTGRTVEFRGDYTSTYVYKTDTQTFTGVFLIANVPVEGKLLQDAGLVEFNNATGEIRTAGRHDALDFPGPFCVALSGG